MELNVYSIIAIAIVSIIFWELGKWFASIDF